MVRIPCPCRRLATPFHDAARCGNPCNRTAIGPSNGPSSITSKVNHAFEKVRTLAVMCQSMRRRTHSGEKDVEPTRRSSLYASETYLRYNNEKHRVRKGM